MRMIKLRKIRLGGNVAQIGLMGNAYTILYDIWEDWDVKWKVAIGTQKENIGLWAGITWRRMQPDG
jgi:hypothetical protein